MESLQSVTVAGSPLTSELYDRFYKYMPQDDRVLERI